MASRAILPNDATLATSPRSIESLPSLIKDISDAVGSLVAGRPCDRKDLLIKCRSLVLNLETPRETMVNHCWAQIGTTAAITFGVDCGLWNAMAQAGDRPHNVDNLAANLGVEPALLGRLMRHLASTGYLKETAKDEYLGNNFTRALCNPKIGHGYLALIPDTSAATLGFQKFSRERGWKNPSDAQDTPHMYAYNTDKDVFAWLQEKGRAQQLSDYLGGYNYKRLSWTDPSLYPIQERLIDGAHADANAPLLVDIGGNIGRDLMLFKRSFPDTPGRLILQDLPAVTRQLKDLDPSIEVMDYDFTTEQPVRGARAYFIHSCMHNWPDTVCEQIIHRVRDAMTPGYSKLLLFELVIPDTGAYWEDTGLDMIVMTVCASEERTSQAWHDLIERRGGLKIEKIWGPGRGQESLIECILE